MPDFPGTLKSPRLSAAPGSPVVGQMYYNTGTNVLSYWNGTTWVSTGGASDPLKVDKDSVVVAATRIVASKLLAGDAQPAFSINGDGTHQWGAGGSTAPDTTLYRSAASTLKTDTDLHARSLGAKVGDTIGQVYVGALVGGNAGVAFGTAMDTAVYRSAAGNLKTDGVMNVGGNVILTGATGAFIARTKSGAVYAISSTGDTQDRFWQSADGTMSWGPGNAAPDTLLYREAAGVLRSDTHIVSAQQIQSFRGGAGQIALASQGGISSGAPTIFFGPGTGDTTLGRKTANQLETGGSLWLHQGAAGAAALVVDNLASDGAILVGKKTADLSYFTIYADGKHGWAGGGGSGVIDTNLYRYAAARLGTDSEFTITRTTPGADAALTIRTTPDAVSRFGIRADGQLQWGDGTNVRNVTLYYYQGIYLKTDAPFVGGDVIFVGNNSNDPNKVGLFFGSAADTRLYRSAAGVLKTGYLDATPYAAAAYVNGNVVFPDTTVFTIPFNADRYNNGNLHTSATRMTAPLDGIYSLKATLSTDGAATMRWLWFNINGAGIPQTRYGQTQAIGPSICASADVKLNAGDYVEAVCYQNTGVSINIPGNDSSPTIFSMHKVN